MATDPEKRGEEPNLELPSLFGLGRKKKQQHGSASSPRPDAAPETPPGPEDASPDGLSSVTPDEQAAQPEGAAPDEQATPARDPLVADPVPDPPGTTEAPTGDLTPAPGQARRLPPMAPPTRRSEPAEPVSVPPEPTSAQAGRPDVAVDGLVEPEADQAAVMTRHRAREQRDARSADADGPDAHSRGSGLRLPGVPLLVAAPVTGAVVGLLGVVLAFLAAQGCEIVRGVGSCGGIGALALTVIVAAEVVLGAALLKVWGVPDPTSTSLLGVGLVAVFSLLFLLDSLMSPLGVVVLPLLTAAAFLGSWWVTSTFAEPSVDDRLHH